MTSSVNMPAQGPPPTPSLSTQAVSQGLLSLSRIRSCPAPGEPPALDSSQHRGPAHQPGSRRASASPRAPLYAGQGRTPPARRLSSRAHSPERGSTTCDGSWTTQSRPSGPGGECSQRVLGQPGGRRGEGTPGTKLEWSSRLVCPAVLRAGTSGLEGGDPGGDGGEAPELGPGPRTTDGAGRS